MPIAIENLALTYLKGLFYFTGFGRDYIFTFDPVLENYDVVNLKLSTGIYI